MNQKLTVSKNDDDDDDDDDDDKKRFDWVPTLSLPSCERTFPVAFLFLSFYHLANVNPSYVAPNIVLPLYYNEILSNNRVCKILRLFDG